VNRVEALNIAQGLLDHYLPGIHGWAENDDDLAYVCHLGTWEPGDEGADIELWPYEGKYQAYAPHYCHSVRWSGHSWREAVQRMADWLEAEWHRKNRVATSQEEMFPNPKG
jgi:hypothetical protein